MIRHQRAGVACLLAAVVLAGAGCSDDVASTAPAATPNVPSLAVAAVKPNPRGPSIASVQLPSPYILLTASDEYTPYTVTVTNPGPKDYQLIYLRGELQSPNFPPVSVSAFLAYCPNPNGVLPRGNCTMSNGITTGWYHLTPGPATFTVKLLQKQADGTMKVLDSKSVNVVLVQ
jgi:hypothetical protein